MGEYTTVHVPCDARGGDLSNALPPTVIVVHPKERRAKCTVESLRGDARFRFYRFPARPESLVGYVRLGLSGPVLSAADASCGLLVLDGTWRWASRMEAAFADVPCRSLPALHTAYPRSSKLFTDPEQGLATIEAIYAAYWCLGRETTGLLRGYRWAESFLERNSAIFAGKEFRPKTGVESAASS